LPFTSRRPLNAPISSLRGVITKRLQLRRRHERDS
jgi:hypothetical protein